MMCLEMKFTSKLNTKTVVISHIKTWDKGNNLVVNSKKDQGNMEVEDCCLPHL